MIGIKFYCLYRPNDFPFQKRPISVSHFNKFRLTATFCLLAIFHAKIMLFLFLLRYGSFLQFYYLCELLLTQETRFSKSCSHWKAGVCVESGDGERRGDAAACVGR